jgi:hypothetical protein
MSDRINQSNRTKNPAEDKRVRSCVEALAALERLHGTRALALAIEEIEHDATDTTGYAERHWAAMPEVTARMEAFGRAIAEADGTLSTYKPRPVTAEPLPPIEETKLYREALAIAAEPLVDDIE